MTLPRDLLLCRDAGDDSPANDLGVTWIDDTPEDWIEADDASVRRARQRFAGRVKGNIQPIGQSKHSQGVQHVMPPRDVQFDGANDLPFVQ